MKLWTPDQQRSEQEEIDKEHQRLVALFKEHPDWQPEADRVHHSLMGAGSACDRCMRMIERRHLALDSKPDS